MASLIPGFDYDIFISYRQKDNKGDRWVSEFVEALKTELESTFKEEVSLYIDINPHDGLLETHDVDASLKEKLRCLIFIPIVSRTYCDPMSFAWEHEFKAFIRQASDDQFGLKIKLSGGNIAGRVLPVRIHDLNTEDNNLLEKELGGALRAIEFIYKEPGVNRPLRINEEHPGDNLNKTVYRNQINKVANAIDELIYSLRSVNDEPGKQKEIYTEQNGISKQKHRDTRKAGERKTGVATKAYSDYKNKLLFAGIITLVILVIAIMFAYPKLFGKAKLEKLVTSDGRISVAVMPFLNMTNDTTWNIWQDGIQFNLISSLSNSHALKVMQTESTNHLLSTKGFTNYSMITPAVAKNISSNMDASVFIYGNINQSGGRMRIIAQLIDSKTAEIFKSFQLNGDIRRILQITDSLSSLIKDYLIISSLKKEIPDDLGADMPGSIEAYKAFILGYKAFLNYDYQSAAKWFLQSNKLDSLYPSTYVWLSISFANQGSYDKAEEWARKIYEKEDQLSFEMKIWVNWICAKYVEKSKEEEVKYSKQLLELNDQTPLSHWLVGHAYYELFQYDNAIPYLEKTISIYKSWNIKPLNGSFYEALIDSYHKTGKYQQEKELLKTALADFPGDLPIIKRQIIFSLTGKDTVTASRYINKSITLRRESSGTDAEISAGLADIYSEAGIPGKAGNYYREAVSLAPDNARILDDLAYFLIDKNINVKEGLAYNDKAFKSETGNRWYLEDTKGWGLHKLGRDKEALEILQKSWDSRPDYRHLLYLHLQEVKRALAGQN